MKKEIRTALDRIKEIMEHPAVVEACGQAYYGDELAKMKAGWESNDPEAIGKALNLGDIMLGRNGFVDLKGIAWLDRDHDVIKAGLEVFNGKSWADRTSGIKEGDKVAYKASFLRSTGQYTGDIPHARGVVESIKDYGGIQLAIINWGDPEIPSKVNVKNLSKVTQRGIADE